MFPPIKIIGTLLLCVSMVACSTTKNPSSEEMQKMKVAKINSQLGLAYLEKNNLKRAKQKLLMALDEAPNIPEPWYSMAYFFESTGNPELAEKHYLKAVQVAPNRGDTHNNYGTFLCRQKRYQASLQQFALATKDETYLSPADAYENAGLCAMKMQHNKQAIGYFKQAIAHDNSRQISRIKLAKLEYKTGQFNQSSQHLHQYALTGKQTQESELLKARLAARRSFQHEEAMRKRIMQEQASEYDSELV